MTDKKETTNWLDDLNTESIDKSASMDIKPTLKVELNETVVCIVKTMPVLTKFADGNSYFTMLFEREKVIYQMNVNAKSFRFSLAVLIKKTDGNIIDRTIAISKNIGNTKEFKNAELYSIQLVE